MNYYDTLPDSKVDGANMGPIWGRQGPGGPHTGPMNFAIWAVSNHACGLYVLQNIETSMFEVPVMYLYRSSIPGMT